jgi:capsular polysaccharide biosynthesis protein
VTNEDELWPWLKSRGFVKVSCEDLTWGEQIAVFRHAKVIVSAHGAALANLVFCARGTKVVELFNRSYVNGYYWRLASIKSLDYRPVAAQGPERLSVDLKENRLDLMADLGEIAKSLSL